MMLLLLLFASAQTWNDVSSKVWNCSADFQHVSLPPFPLGCPPLGLIVLLQSVRNMKVWCMPSSIVGQLTNSKIKLQFTNCILNVIDFHPTG